MDIVKKREKQMAIARVFFGILGFLAFGLGTVGIFLPVLPTTPFYMFATFCFSRSSDRFDRWLKGTKLYKRHLEAFVKNRAMPIKTKLCICVPVTIMLALAAYVLAILPMQICIAALLLLKWYYFMFRIETMKQR